ncbi:hypothetical protein [Hirschia baltica]|uniref:Transmembrane protein n=1 Tax=Hirschia baltica (strain ATCC 49814 / DSM 5838 / IFAM 1418) TaxID=582402 RepID=C6XI37_HIRBI|nr:hypothetical protein [Hirschia baltica]ACT58863.1 hypothetical protein Hbal_1171 [Hirschia baltica ATCC 49814]
MDQMINAESLLQIHELIGQHRELISNTWQFFVSVHIAIFGLLFMINPDRVNWASRLVLFMAYSGFMYLNYNAQIDNYTYAMELLNLAKELEFGLPDSQSIMTNVFNKPGWVLEYLVYIFGVAACIGGTLILIPNHPKLRGSNTNIPFED